MQKAYISALYELMEKDKRVLSCLSDSGTDLDEMMMREFPNQVINFGISENNKVAASAGLAERGFIPFVYTTSAFLSYRSYEFIRDDICLQNRNVKLVGMGCGLSWSTLGPTHHSTEELGVLKSLPNLTILSPASPKELKECVKCAYENDGPFYIRMGMGNEKEIYEEECPFKLGRNNVIADGKIPVFFTGPIAEELLKAREILSESGYELRLINVSTIKPLNTDDIYDECEKNRIVISVEEHNVEGGLGSSIADVIAERYLDCRLYKIGLESFGEGFGSYKEVLAANGLSCETIATKISKTIEK